MAKSPPPNGPRLFLVGKSSCRWPRHRVFAAFDAAHPTCDPVWVEWQAARRAAAAAAGCTADEAAAWCSLSWFAMYIDDAMAGSADDLVVDAAGLPVLDGAGVPMRRARLHFDIARGVVSRMFALACVVAALPRRRG
jgi:hypothetical protein